jgi:predicted PurR-regulated permease PerM
MPPEGCENQKTPEVYTFDRVFRLGLTGAIIVGLVWLMSYLSDVLIPFVAALVMAYLMDPLVLLVQRLVKKRWAAVFITLFISALALVLIWTVMAPAVAGEIKRAGVLIRELVTNNQFAQNAAQYIPEDIWKAIRDLAKRPEVQELFSVSGLNDLASILAKRVLPGLWGLITTAGSLLISITGLFIILLYLVFLLLEFPTVQTGWPRLIPQKYRQGVLEFVEEAESALATYFRGQTLVAALVGVLFALGFWIIGLPLGIILGLFVGVLNMVPYLQLIAIVPAFFLALLHVIDTGKDFWIYMAMTGGVFLVVQLIQDAVSISPHHGQSHRA